MIPFPKLGYTVENYIFVPFLKLFRKKIIPNKIYLNKNEKTLVNNFQKDVKNKYDLEKCVIVGNGPSLNNNDLSLLKNTLTIGVNSIFLMTEKNGFKPDIYVVEDKLVFEDNYQEILDYDVKYKILPKQYKTYINPKYRKNIIFLPFNTSFGLDKTPRFSKDIKINLFTGGSVTYVNMQIAAFLGFKNIYLIGVDFNYIEPKSLIKNGDVWTSTTDDSNHFDERYFGKGKRWHDPKLSEVKLNYELALKISENNNFNFFNATSGGSLEVFERVDYESLFR